MTMLNSYREFKLPNGLVVALQNTPTQTIAAKLRVNYGASHEREGEEGLAHFLEHCLVTTGSQKYDPVQADKIRGNFGHFNANTSVGRINFVGEMLAEDFETWMDYTSDHILRPRFDDVRVNGERQRVLREISDTKSKPTYSTVLEWRKIFYENHPKGRFVLGKENVVRDVNISKMREFHGRGFNPNNMDLIIVGGLPLNIEEMVRNYFGNIPAGDNCRLNFPEPKPLNRRFLLHIPAPENLNVDNPENSSAHLQITYSAPAESHPDTFAIRTMNHIYGGDTNSLLFQNIALKMGLYSISASYNGDYNCGELNTNADVPAKSIDAVVDLIFEQMKVIKTQRINDETVGRIKKLAEYNLAKTYDSNGGHIGAIERTWDDGITPEGYIAGFNKVTPEKIMEVANRYYPDKKDGNYITLIRDPLMK